MIGLGIQQIKSRILSEGNISEEELNSKIKTKLDQLSGLISEEGAAHIIANELGIKLFKQQEGGQLKINDIAQGMRNVDVVGKIIRKFELRNFQTAERQGKVASFILADETGSIRITLWNDQADMFQGLNEGDILRIKSGYVRNNNGRAEIHLNDRSKVDINPEGVEVKAIESGAGSGYARPVRKKLNELKEEDRNIEILGTIVQVYDIRFFESCAECNKRLINKEGVWSCPTHGQVNPDYNYVMNTFIDDGTDSIRATFWKRQIQALLGKDDSEIQQFRADPASFEPLKTELLGNIVKLVGNARMNQQMNSLEFSANLVFNNPDPNEELQRLKEAKAPSSTEGEVSGASDSVADPVIESGVETGIENGIEKGIGEGIDSVEQKIEETVNDELEKVPSSNDSAGSPVAGSPVVGSQASAYSTENKSENMIRSDADQAIIEDLEENVVEEASVDAVAPVIEQKPTPENIAFETPSTQVPVSERMDKSGIDDDLVSIEDLEDLDDLDNL